MVKKITITTVLIFCLGAVLFSQENYTKHQIGINASKFVVIFNEQVSNLDLCYRYALSGSKSLRLSSSIDVSTEEGDFSDYEVRGGYDFIFKESSQWNFYTGFDLTFGQSITTSTERVTTKLGSYIFLGVLFKMGKHFSFSTEPSLALFGKFRKDPLSFEASGNKSWMEVKFQNIGQIKIGFHF